MEFGSSHEILDEVQGLAMSDVVEVES